MSISDDIRAVIELANREKTAEVAPSTAPQTLERLPVDWALKLADDVRQSGQVSVADVARFLGVPL